jgi:50S ribosomal protein L16 3-hydroxylase
MLDPGSFLGDYWQKAPLFMPGVLDRLRPAVTRNELAWLATLDDVESRLVFTDRGGDRVRYRAETGPFEPEHLAALPRRDWTLLVHDIEKHLPNMRRLFALVPFVPDWRIDDLMVSFAAPGGGVGPHRDHYDVFLCQGIGVREWRVTSAAVEDDRDTSDDLALTREFEAEATLEAREGDVLYLPPGLAHWGTARRACITYSIGMRAPQLTDLGGTLPDREGENLFYKDPDLDASEARPGYISVAAVTRAQQLLGEGDHAAVATLLGRFATLTKDWIRPETVSRDEAKSLLAAMGNRVSLPVHGMARLAFDERNVYVNGSVRALPAECRKLVAGLCATRHLRMGSRTDGERADLLLWLLESGAFEIPGNL